MKKILLLLITLSAFFQASSQERYFTRDGYISFHSKTPAEDINAQNHKATSVLDAGSGQLEFAVLMKAFEFKKALMQQHFNENYVESGKYPKATFKGKITDIEKVDFKKDGTYNVTANGNLTIKDVTKEITTPALIVIENGKINGKTEFMVHPEDYNIEIPSLVKDKIEKDIKVKVDVHYQPL